MPHAGPCRAVPRGKHLNEMDGKARHFDLIGVLIVCSLSLETICLLTIDHRITACKLI